MATDIPGGSASVEYFLALFFHLTISVVFSSNDEWK